MPGWFWKRWVWAAVGGTAVAVGSAVVVHADGQRPVPATTGYTLNESITLKFPGQPDRKVTVVKTTRKPGGAVETVVKDPRTGETFTLTDNAWDGKANPPAAAKPAAPAGKAAAPAAKANTLPRARPRTDPPPAPKGNDPTPAAFGSAFDSAPRSTPGKAPAATVSPAAGLGSAFGPAPAPASTPKPAPAASGPTRLPASVAPLPAPTLVADRDKDRRLFGGKLFQRDQPPARPAPVVEAPPEGDKKPGILGRLFGSKKSTPAPGPSAAMPAAPYTAPPAPYVPPVATTTPYVPPAPAASPNTGSLAFPSPAPSAEPPRVMPPKPAAPPPAAVRSTPVVPPKPVVAVPAPLPTKPAPVAKPAPEPPPVVKSTPAPVPVAKPAPEPTPEPPPAPVSKPAPEPTSVPVPVPVPVTKPAPEPTSVPVPRPESKPVLPPASVPVPLPPVSAPVPVPAPVVPSVSAPAIPPVTTPVPVPVPLPVPPGGGALPPIPLPGPQSAAPAAGVTHAGYASVEPAVFGDVKPFATALRDAAAPSARIRAAKGLADGRHGSTDAVKALLFQAAQADPCPAVQAACIDHLCRLGYYHPAFLTYLKAACDAPAEEVRESARAALAKMTPRQP